MASAVNDLVAGTGGASGRPLTLHADRFFDADPATRRAARELYEGTRDLPLVCPHGHVDPALLSENDPFPEPIIETEGVIQVQFVEFASLPDSPGPGPMACSAHLSNGVRRGCCVRPEWHAPKCHDN